MNPLFFNEYLAENYYRIHPAMAGVNLNGIRIDFGTRQQWFGVTDRPATNMLTLEYKTTAKTTLGFSGFSDQNGYHSHYKYNFTYCYRIYFNNEIWKKAVKNAYQQALVKLEAVEAPAGEQTVILGPGWPGILLHEAIGHGLEGDFNRKKTSAFHNLVGLPVASEQITIVDDGTISDRRGSLTIDDEGTPSQNTTLIENGILKNFMQDRLNARLMKSEPLEMVEGRVTLAFQCQE